MNTREIAETAITQFGAKQDGEELAEFLAWLRDLRPRPKYILEIGVYRGGSMWAMQQVVPDATFIGIDCSFKRLGRCEFRTGTHFIFGRSGSVSDQVRRLYDPEEAVVFIDGDHSYDAVVMDSELYPARHQVFHDVKDGRKADRERLVCHFYQERQEEFVELFSRHKNFVGIGVRVPPALRGGEHGHALATR